MSARDGGTLPRPPAWVERLVFGTPDAGSETHFLLGDLREEFADRVARGLPRWRACLWLGFEGSRARLKLRWATRGSGRSRGPIGPPRGGPWHDLAQAITLIRRRPKFALLVGLTMATGVAATAVMLAAVQTILLTPLPWRDPDQVYAIETRLSGARWAGSSAPEFVDLRNGLSSFSELAGYSGSVALLGDSLAASRLPSALVTGNLFPLLGATAALGRVPGPEDGLAGAEPVLVVSHRTWLRELGGDSAVVGSVVSLNGQPATVIGVMPPGFDFPDESTALWEAWRLELESPNTGRANHFIRVIARLAPGAEPGRARAELATIQTRIARAYPGIYRDNGLTLRMRPFLDVVLEGVDRPMRLLLGAALLLLGIATANAAMLLVNRRSARRQEITLRVALGSSTRRAMLPFVIEGWAGVLGGAALGLGFAGASLGWVRSLGLSALPRADLLRIGAPTLVAVSVAVLVAGGLVVVLGLGLGTARNAPALVGRRVSLDRSAARSSRALVVAQIALAMMLCAGAGLMARTVRALTQLDSGVRPEGVLTLRVTPRGASYRMADQRIELHRRIRERLLALPGVTEAGAALNLPYAGAYNNDWTYQTEADQNKGVGESPFATVQMVSPGYFEAAGIRVEGRSFGLEDRADGLLSVIVNRAFADRHWPGGSAIGRRIRVFNQPTKPWMEVVGVADDVRSAGLDRDPQPIYYVPSTQSHQSTYFTPREMYLLVRGSGDPSALAEPVRRAIAEIDPTIVLSTLRPFAEVVSEAIGPRAVMLWVLSGFGAVALLLASLGVLAMTLMALALRRAEIGIRLTLGERRGALMRRLLFGTLAPVAVGVAIGGTVTLLGARVGAALLFGVPTWDPPAMLGAALVLASAAAAAASLPSYRATGRAPLETLRATRD